MNDQEVEEFLEHHGVKGMKWGVRNQKTNVTTRKKERKKAVTDSAKRIAIGTAIGVGTLAVVATGAAFANFLMNKNKNTPVLNIRKTTYTEKAKKGAEIAKLITSFKYTEEKSSMPKHSERWKKNAMEKMRKDIAKFNFENR